MIQLVIRLGLLAFLIYWTFVLTWWLGIVYGTVPFPNVWSELLFVIGSILVIHYLSTRLSFRQ